MNDLTNNQKRILGIAYGVNQLTLGQVKSLSTLAITGEGPIKYEGISDFQWPLAAHLIYKLAFTRYNHSVTLPELGFAHDDAYFTFLDKNVTDVKNSIESDISYLIAHDYLEESIGRAIRPRWGYILTEAGYQIGEKYQEYVTPFQVLRSGIYIFLLDAHDEKINLFEKLDQSNMGLKEFLTWFNLHCPRGIVTQAIVDEFCNEFNVKNIPHKFVEFIIKSSFKHEQTLMNTAMR